MDVPDALTTIHDAYPDLMQTEVIEVVRIYMAKEILEGIPSLPGIPNIVTSTYNIIVTYDMNSEKYTVTVSKNLM